MISNVEVSGDGKILTTSKLGEDRCPEGLLGLILPPYPAEMEAAIDKRGIRRDVDRWRKDPREVARAEAVLGQIRKSLDGNVPQA